MLAYRIINVLHQKAQSSKCISACRLVGYVLQNNAAVDVVKAVIDHQGGWQGRTTGTGVSS